MGDIIEGFSFYNNRKVLITGHTGFKGSWLSIWLNKLGAEVCGYSLEPYTVEDNFVVSGIGKRVVHQIGDIRDFNRLWRLFEHFQPEIVFHLAAQPIVRTSYIEPKETFDVNIGGTVNVLECCRLSDSARILVNVTSDKCYENRERARGYRENDPLGGHDPYSASKAGSEIVCKSYRDSFFNTDRFDEHGKCVASARAGNVIGGGDWQKDRLIPDCIRSLEKGESILLRNPGSTRPWQHVLEPLAGYLLLALKMASDPSKFSTAWNFGPEGTKRATVGELADMIVDQWGSGTVETADVKPDLHEAGMLWLDITKAKTELGWNPAWDIRRTVSTTVDWYRRYKTEDVFEICEQQIDRYMGSIQND